MRIKLGFFFIWQVWDEGLDSLQQLMLLKMLFVPRILHPSLLVSQSCQIFCESFVRFGEIEDSQLPVHGSMCLKWRMQTSLS
jgi:hypothetical protein